MITIAPRDPNAPYDTLVESDEGVYVELCQTTGTINSRGPGSPCMERVIQRFTIDAPMHVVLDKVHALIGGS